MEPCEENSEFLRGKQFCSSEGSWPEPGQWREGRVRNTAWPWWEMEPARVQGTLPGQLEHPRSGRAGHRHVAPWRQGRRTPLGEGVRDGLQAEPPGPPHREVRKGRCLQRMKEQKEDQRPKGPWAERTRMKGPEKGGQRGRARGQQMGGDPAGSPLSPCARGGRREIHGQAPPPAPPPGRFAPTTGLTPRTASCLVSRPCLGESAGPFLTSARPEGCFRTSRAGEGGRFLPGSPPAPRDRCQPALPPPGTTSTT